MGKQRSPLETMEEGLHVKGERRRQEASIKLFISWIVSAPELTTVFSQSRKGCDQFPSPLPHTVPKTVSGHFLGTGKCLKIKR